MRLWAFQNNLSFSLCVILFTYYLVVTSEIKVEFNKEYINKKKYIDLILVLIVIEIIVDY